jgi:cell division protein FtsW
LSTTILQHARTGVRAPRLALDPVIILATAGLLLLGLVMVTSASISVADRQLGNPFFYLERQLMFTAIGILFAAVALRIPLAALEKLGFVLLVIAFVLLLAVLLPGLGHEVNGSKRWLRVGPLNFQASEAARVLLLTYLCGYLVRRQEEVNTTVAGFLKPLAVLGAAGVLLLAEPDFGSAVVLLATGIGVLFIAGVRLKHFIVLCAGTLALGAVVAVSSAYRVKRLTGFLDPWADPFKSGFQLTQSLIAIGRGEWTGVGLGDSVQKLFYLPEAHTDFVFAVLAEELGFLGIALTVFLFMVLVVRALRLSRLANEAGMRFHAYMAAAFGIWLGMQAIINMGVNMGLLPTKGLTLPLLSYGRSSLLVTLGWIGILLRIHHEVVGSRAAVPKAGAR